MQAPNDGRTLFVISDVHSFYEPMKTALREAGYDPKNPGHLLVSLGDILDRGPDSLKVIRFLKSVPKERRVLIRGNHERLLRDCVARGFCMTHDESNGTANTLYQLSGYDPDWKRRMTIDAARRGLSADEMMKEYFARRDLPFSSRRVANVIKWMFGDEWQDFFEYGDYVFVHSWVPTKAYGVDPDSDANVVKVDPDWRMAGESAWDRASWGCPWRQYLDGLLPEGKTIVCGHWHVQDFHLHLGHDLDGINNRNIYFGDRLIAIDACTAMSPHICNVLVIKDGVCYDKHRKALIKA